MTIREIINEGISKCEGRVGYSGATCELINACNIILEEQGYSTNPYVRFTHNFHTSVRTLTFEVDNYSFYIELSFKRSTRGYVRYGHSYVVCGIKDIYKDIKYLDLTVEEFIAERTKEQTQREQERKAKIAESLAKFEAEHSETLDDYIKRLYDTISIYDNCDYNVRSLIDKKLLLDYDCRYIRINC